MSGLGRRTLLLGSSLCGFLFLQGILNPGLSFSPLPGWNRFALSCRVCVRARILLLLLLETGSSFVSLLLFLVCFKKKEADLRTTSFCCFALNPAGILS